MIQAKELIHEIHYLEEEVVDLEKHVLSLYRQFFDRCLSRSSSLLHSSPKNNIRHACSGEDEPSSDHGKPWKIKTGQANTALNLASLIRPNSRHGSGLGGSANVKGHFHSFDFENNSNHARTEVMPDSCMGKCMRIGTLT
jgi:hypothetical protein